MHDHAKTKKEANLEINRLYIFLFFVDVCMRLYVCSLFFISFISHRVRMANNKLPIYSTDRISKILKIKLLFIGNKISLIQHDFDRVTMDAPFVYESRDVIGIYFL